MKGCFREDNNFFFVFRGKRTNNELTLQEKIFLISIKEGVKEQKSERVVRESYGKLLKDLVGQSLVRCDGHNWSFMGQSRDYKPHNFRQLLEPTCSAQEWTPRCKVSEGQHSRGYQHCSLGVAVIQYASLLTSFYLEAFTVYTFNVSSLFSLPIFIQPLKSLFLRSLR